MNRKTFVMYEVSQKQKYIFQTNRLIENMGASKIIREITEDPQNLFNSLCREPFSLFKEDQIDYKIIGGGNATYIFRDTKAAQHFAKQLTSLVLRYIPGLEVFLVMEKDVNWDDENEKLYDLRNDEGIVVKRGILSQMRDRLATKKNMRKHAVQQLTWGIHEICSSSGLPATDKRQNKDNKKYVPCAKELVVKEKMGVIARNEDFVKRLIEPSKNHYEFLNESHMTNVFQEGKDQSTKSYLAIVHIDGNAMGIKVSEFLKYQFTSNDEYIKEYQQFTEKIDLAYTNAFRKTIEHLMNTYEQWAQLLYGTDKLDKLSNIIPLRPIVASGDDICFITYGQLGVELARIFIQYLQQETIEINNKKFSFEACAGVAIVKHKFPFWLAYEFAEILCSNAKKRLKFDQEQWIKLGITKNGEQFDTSLIDWHIVSGGDLQLDLSQYRQASYLNKDGSYLLQRPFYLQRKEDTYRHDANYNEAFLHAMEMIIKKDTNKDEKENVRSKWKALREVYHLGRNATNQWQIRSQFDLNGNQLFLKLNSGFKPHGAENSEYVSYFYDALDLVDYFIPLGEVKQLCNQ